MPKMYCPFCTFDDYSQTISRNKSNGCFLCKKCHRQFEVTLTSATSDRRFREDVTDREQKAFVRLNSPPKDKFGNMPMTIAEANDRWLEGGSRR